MTAQLSFQTVIIGQMIKEHPPTRLQQPKTARKTKYLDKSITGRQIGWYPDTKPIMRFQNLQQAHHHRLYKNKSLGLISWSQHVRTTACTVKSWFDSSPYTHKQNYADCCKHFTRP